MKVILITGASSGIGYAAAEMLARQGHRVYAAARRTAPMEPLKALGAIPLGMDVTSEESAKAGLEQILSAEGRIDALVCNAGYGQMGAIETVSLDEGQKQLDVNLFGVVRLVQMVVPHMRRQGSGRIVLTSSMAGKMPFPMAGWYNISKYSIEALGDNLAMELRPFGIKVSLIEPAAIKTKWGFIAADNLENSSAGTHYEERARHEAALFRLGYSSKLFTDPSVVARKICRATLCAHPRLRYRCGLGTVTGTFLHTILPARWWQAVVGLLCKL